MTLNIRSRLTPVFFLIIALIWIADAATKIWAVEALSDGSVINILGNTLRFQLVYNTGGVFGIFQGNAIVFQILTGFAIGFLFWYYLTTDDDSPLFRLAINFILAGAFGNFTDRFFRRGVVDFIDMGIGVHRWPTYNVADSFISIGAVLLFIAYWQQERLRKSA